MAATSVSMDYFEASVNPCSVESIPEPVVLSDQSSVWPVMLGCYELQENGTRHGRLDLYTIRAPDLNKHLNTSINLRFGKPLPALCPEETRLSGVLDGKWIRAPASSNDKDNQSFYFASAHSSGQIAIHSCTQTTEDDNLQFGPDGVESSAPLKLNLMCKSEALESKNGRNPLCLALSWDSSRLDDSSRIVSTYSDGRVAIHDLVMAGARLELIEHASWEAHTMFTVPAEVWCAGFVEREAILSGGDDGNLKLWDLRSFNRPMHVLKHFDAGVTVVSPHPRQPNLVACGSYDETINLYDVRYMSVAAKPLARSGPLGGGIWRLKWNPYDDNRLLVAAMHGGCRLVKIDKLHEEDTPVMVATKEFTEHKSMAYGADWLVCKHPTEVGYFEAAASCSFYDRGVYLWDTVA